MRSLPLMIGARFHASLRPSAAMREARRENAPSVRTVVASARHSCTCSTVGRTGSGGRERTRARRRHSRQCCPARRITSPVVRRPGVGRASTAPASSVSSAGANASAISANSCVCACIRRIADTSCEVIPRRPMRMTRSARPEARRPGAGCLGACAAPAAGRAWSGCMRVAAACAAPEMVSAGLCSGASSVATHSLRRPFSSA
mmetsp:Transcript_14785/g.38471  ORF Transcript_14785/g.38471 Transcript_14785/m.38471 type:complete len:203 (+) Transcript_14785:389-997(+)